MTYINAISIGFPGINCHIVGNDDVYENIIWDSGLPIPNKETLDQWLLSNPNAGSEKLITVLAFRNRFTKVEKITMELASIDSPSASIEHRQMAAAIRVDMKDSDNASYIDLNRPETRAGVQTLELFGIIGAGRANIILTASIVDNERYRK